MQPEKKVRTDIIMQILLNILIGESSECYKELYKSGDIFAAPSLDYEFTDNYAHILITGSSKSPEKVYDKIKQKIEEIKTNGINNDDFCRIKKMLYGEYVKEYNDVSDIARMFLSDYLKGINSFEYLEEIESIELKEAKTVFDNSFKADKMVFSVVKKN